MAKGDLTPDGVFRYRCPGCRSVHHAETIHRNSGGGLWSFNGDFERPTLSPSVHYVGACHHFVRDGRIEFLPDCSHDLAGQTVDLPELNLAPLFYQYEEGGR